MIQWQTNHLPFTPQTKLMSDQDVKSVHWGMESIPPIQESHEYSASYNQHIEELQDREFPDTARKIEFQYPSILVEKISPDSVINSLFRISKTYIFGIRRLEKISGGKCWIALSCMYNWVREFRPLKESDSSFSILLFCNWRVITNDKALNVPELIAVNLLLNKQRLVKLSKLLKAPNSIFSNPFQYILRVAHDVWLKVFAFRDLIWFPAIYICVAS